MGCVTSKSITTNDNKNLCVPNNESHIHDNDNPKHQGCSNPGDEHDIIIRKCQNPGDLLKPLNYPGSDPGDNPAVHYVEEDPLKCPDCGSKMYVRSDQVIPSIMEKHLCATDRRPFCCDMERYYAVCRDLNCKERTPCQIKRRLEMLPNEEADRLNRIWKSAPYDQDDKKHIMHLKSLHTLC